ncbi:MAG: RNA-directed DNA polymerase [Methylococcales bacterium]
MSLLDEKYKELQPTEDYLTNKIVLAQAWKKAHQYIRSTNWYADTFELDRSAIDLDSLLDKWIDELLQDDFNFNPLRIVPAPKSERWHFEKIEEGKVFFQEGYELSKDYLEGFSHGWVPILNDDEVIKPLRPLAHVGIRDQTLMMALMMCIANEIETLQGATSTDMIEVHVKGVVSYGNRLFCQFDEDDKASFTWGNATSYSKYFSDYQHFLRRPAYFGLEALKLKIKNETIYEIHLDIEKFYDRIERSGLTDKIWDICDHENDPILERLLVAFDKWSWEKGSSNVYDSVCKSDDKPIPQGVPQGLVAGGFLANVYLLDFDKEMHGLISNEIKEGIHLVDYCRYVDDMRLVIIANNDENIKSITNAINTVIGEKLNKIGLSFNKDKTLVEKFRPKTGGVSQKLRDIQSKVSGPLSVSEIDEQLGHLEGLIGLADSLRKTKVDKDNTNPLARIDGPNNDVREDTLLRFSANKICALLKQKRSLYAQEIDENNETISGSWDYLQERMARKFIACWSEDPSLVLMLKKGLELFPDRRLLEPVLLQLDVVSKRKSEKQSRVAEYCLGEIFRHSAIGIHTKEVWSFPAHANVEGYFDLLINYAVDIAADEKVKNKNIIDQARFLCLVRNESPLDVDTSEVSFNIITKLVKGYRNISSKIKVTDLVTDALLAYQLAGDKRQVVKSVNHLIQKASGNLNLKKDTLSQNDVTVFLEKTAVESPEFFAALVAYAKSSKFKWLNHCSELVSKTGILDNAIIGDINKFKKPVSLLGVIKRTDNPFAHENAVLALTLAILNDGKYEPNKKFDESSLSPFTKIVDIANCKIECDDWSKIQSLEIGFSIHVKYVEEDHLFPAPKWVNEKHIELYHLGIFIRSCLLGNLDWSAMNASIINYSRYTGLKTSLLKRQLGMMHSPEAINGENAPMTGWLTSFIFHLLQWPGSTLHSGGYIWPSDWNMRSVSDLILKRIELQKKIFCHQSGIPAYIEKVNLDWDVDKKDLKVVMVQSLLPNKSDFKDYGFLLSDPKYRARHRRHVAAVAELILHKVYSHNSTDDVNYKQTKVDLIIWPELAVNDDDIDILKSLADKTGAMVFTGITFKSQKGIKGPNNLSKWIIPSKHSTGLQYITRYQGKKYLTADEIKHAQPWRPYQLLIELVHPAFPNEQGFILTGSICYDATDIKMCADLKDKSNAYLIPSLNKDVSTFDSMVDALYYHMYQHVVLVNTGEFGGSVAMAPYKERYDKLITHVHGVNQVSISTFEMNMFDFRDIGKSLRSAKDIKTKPAG